LLKPQSEPLVIPVGWLYKPIYEMQVGDVIRPWGKILKIEQVYGDEIWDEETGDSYQELTFDVSTPSAVTGRTLITNFEYADEVKLLIYHEVDEEEESDYNQPFEYLQMDSKIL
jgi:hypothetical protein